MSAGLAALLDDVATLARLAAASIDDVGAAAGRASAKAAGVVVDDAAVTPQFVAGVAAKRELPIIAKIARGSIINKLAFILPALLLLSKFLPWLLTPLLMLGGAYLCFEGAEKVIEKVTGKHHDSESVQIGAPKDEDTLVKGAVRTDFILSAEIMVIALNEVAAESLVSRAVILVVVAFFITAVVYGVVALIVKMDDVGLRLATSGNSGTAAFGRGLVSAMPPLMAALAVVGTAAMLWVGGHILLVGTHDLGFDLVYDAVHHVEEMAHEGAGAIGGFAGWVVNTAFSAVIGLIVGAVIAGVVHIVAHRGSQGPGH